MKEVEKTSRGERLRHSLYSRAFLFAAIGSGALLGAIGVQTSMMVNGSVDQLLEDRTQLARTTGNYIEHLIRRDLNDLATAAESAVVPGDSRGIGDRLREKLGPVYPITMFQEGVLVLDKEGKILGGVPDIPSGVEAQVDFKALSAKALARLAPVVSPLVHLPVGERPVLIFVQPIRNDFGVPVGSVCGILHPVSKNMVAMFGTGLATDATLQLVDANGTVIGSTRVEDMFRSTDHQNLISGAIRAEKQVKGRCHACHESTSNTEQHRNTEVLAFAPLPTLSLGVAVRQAESTALAPAFRLRDRLFLLGTTFIGLFILFGGLAVRSVVEPVQRLTRAVLRRRPDDLTADLPSFGKDEVGELASVLNQAQHQVAQSIGEVRAHEAALHSEVERTQRHLAMLQTIADFSFSGKDFDAIVRGALEQILLFSELPAGALALTYGSRKFSACTGMSDDEALRILEAGVRDGSAENAESQPAGTAVVRGLTPQRTWGTAIAGLESLLYCAVSAPQGFQLECVLGRGSPGTIAIEERHLQSFLHHVAMAVANRILHEQEILRGQQSREFVARLLKAQEAERLRIARELHDTIAQELAAHKLELERIGKNATASAPLRTAIDGLEAQAYGMLVTLRQLLVDLRPSVLDTMGFLPALQWYLEKLGQDSKIKGTLSVEGNEVKLSHELEITLFRIFQECLRNIETHSKAEHVMVTVTYGSRDLEISIEDDGAGFNVEEVTKGTVREDGHGLGLLGMMERAKLLGGRIVFDSAPGEGTTITVSIPLEDRK